MKIVGYRKIPAKKFKKIILAGAIGLAALNSTSCKNSQDSRSVYTSTITNENDVNLYDKDGNIITTFSGNDEEKNFIITSKKVRAGDKKYEAVVIEDNGDMISGYLEGNDINIKEMDEVKDFYDKEDKFNIGIIAAPDGVFARQEKKVDKNTENANLLNEGTYVLCGLPETSKDNAYTWRKILYFEDDILKTAYMVEDYLLDLENIEKNKSFRVEVSELRLREDASVNVDAITSIPNGENVYLVKNVASKQDDIYNWLYVAYNNVELSEIELGWVAATDRVNDIDYLKEIVDEPNELEDKEISSKIKRERDSNNTRIKQIVDTSSANYNDLKLRNEPTIKSDIKAKLQDGTEVFITQNYIDDSEKIKNIDGFDWIQVILENGETGYVAKKYLRADKIVDDKDPTIEVNKRTKVFDEGYIDGVVGIDIVPEIIGIGNFEEILKGNISISSETGIGNIGEKPEFIYLSMGASAYGDFAIVGEGGKIDSESIEKRKESVRAFINKCEEYKIPWGGYYYSQARNEDETQQEIDYIKDVFNGMGDLKYNVIPFAVDIENQSGIMAQYVNGSFERKEELTGLKESMMESLRNELNQEVVMYSDHNSLVEIIDYTLLSERNKKDMWIVDPNKTHSDDLINMGLVDYIGNRQVALDTNIYQGINVDIDFMNLDVFKNYIKGIEEVNYEFIEKNENTIEER